MASAIIQSVINGIGAGVCILAICAFQWALVQLTKYFIPNLFKRTEIKRDSAEVFYERNNRKYKNGQLQPLGQEKECNTSYDYYEDNTTPVLLFASTWTLFVLLLEIAEKRLSNQGFAFKRIIRRLATKCKQNRKNYK